MFVPLSVDKKPLVSLEQKLHAVDVCLRLDQTGLSTPLSVPPVLSDFQPPPYLPPPPALLSMLKSLEGVEAVEEHVVVEKIYHIGTYSIRQLTNIGYSIEGSCVFD